MDTITTPPRKVNSLYVPVHQYEKTKKCRDALKLKVKNQTRRIDLLEEKLKTSLAIIATFEVMNFCANQPAGVCGKIITLKAQL